MGTPCPRRARGEHPLPERRLADGVGRGGDVHDEGGAGPGELRDRIPGIARPVPEPLVVPDVLADREAEPDPRRGRVGEGGAVRREEVARLVEDVVGGQERLAADRCQPPSVEERHRVVDARRRGARRRLGEPEGDRDPAGPVRRPGELGQRPGGAVEELGEVEQVAGRVAAQRELGEDDQGRARRARLGRGVADPPRVPVEVADGGVDLRERDASGWWHGATMVH